MLPQRLRGVAAGIPIVLFSAVLVAGPGFAAESLVITSPLAGTTVSGPLAVEGSIDGDTGLEVALGLARQTLGECGSTVIESRVRSAAGQFSASFATTAVPDGTYCVVAVADAGRLSTAVGDVVVDNSAVNNSAASSDSLDGLQLPTLPFGDEARASLTGESTAPANLGDLSLLGPLVLGAAGGLALLVLGVGLRVRRRTAR